MIPNSAKSKHFSGTSRFPLKLLSTLECGTLLPTFTDRTANFAVWLIAAAPNLPRKEAVQVLHLHESVKKCEQKERVSTKVIGKKEIIF